MEGGMAGAYIMGGGIIIIIPRCGIGCGIICSTGFTGGSIIIFDTGAAVGGGIGMGSSCCCMFSTIGALAWGSISGIVTAKGRSVVGGGGFT